MVADKGATEVRDVETGEIDLKTEEEKLQALREKGFRMFVEDMNNGGYPESKHEIKI